MRVDEPQVEEERLVVAPLRDEPQRDHDTEEDGQPEVRETPHGGRARRQASSHCTRGVGDELARCVSSFEPEPVSVLPEQALRPDRDHHEHQHVREHRPVPSTSGGSSPSFSTSIGSSSPPKSCSVSPISERAERGAAEAAEPAEDGGGEPEEHVREAQGEVEAAERTDQRPGEAGQQRRDAERQHRQAGRLHAVEPRRLAIGGDGADLTAEARPGEQRA